MSTATETVEDTVSRRSLTKTVVTGGVAFTVPAFASVVRGETDSGFVEITTDATIPTDTAIQIRVFEDDTGDGTANRQQEKTISTGTDVVTEYDALNGFEAQGYHYWMDITLSTSDENATPELDSMTITLPADEPEEPEEVTAQRRQGLRELWDNPYVFMTGVILSAGAIGLGSKSMAIASWGAYMIFAVYAITTDVVLLQNIFYVTLVLIFVGFGFKLWRLEGDGAGS